MNKFINQPWNLNPKPFSNLYHNTKIHNNGAKGWLNGTPDWARSLGGGAGLGASSMGLGNGGDCGC